MVIKMFVEFGYLGGAPERFRISNHKPFLKDSITTLYWIRENCKHYNICRIRERRMAKWEEK